MAQQIVFFDDTNANAQTTIDGMRADFDKYGINCALGINISGVSTFTGAIIDNNEQVGAAGSILSSTGAGVRWIPAGEGNTASASNVGTNEDSDDAEQWVTFVGAKSGNNPIRVDDDLRYNPSTNILTTGGVDLGDGKKIRLGDIAGTPDLEIYHTTDSGGYSAIVDNGTGNLVIGSSLLEIKSADLTEQIATFTEGESVNLNFKTTERIRTADGGVVVTGICTATSFEGDGSALTGIDNYSVFTGATNSADGSTGLVKKPLTGDQNKFLRADSTWVIPDDTTYNAFGGTDAGLVPASTSEQVDKFLRSDGSWTDSQVKSDWDATTGLAEILNKPDVLKFKTFKIRLSAGDVEDTNFFNIVAATTTDTFEIVKGANVTLTADTGNKKLTIAAANDNDNTTYDLSVPDSTTAIRLAGSDTTNDDITITGGSNITVTRNSGTQLTIAGSADTTYDLLVPDSTTAIRLSPLSGTNDDITITGGTNVTVTRTSATELNIAATQATKADLDVDHLITLSGVAAASDDLGEFTGSTITDNSTIKVAIQELETELETKPSSDTNTTYTLPGSGTQGTNYTDSKGSATITLTGANPTSTDAVTVTAGSNIQIVKTGTDFAGGFTINAQNTTYSAFTAATNLAAGAAGLVVAPAAGDHVKFLRGDATWSTVNASTITVADESGETADSECFLLFSKDATGSETVHSNSGLKFDADEKTIETSKFIVTGGTSSQFLKADGSVDSNTYVTSSFAGTTYTFGVEAPSNNATDRENLKITAGGVGSGDQLIGFVAGHNIDIGLNVNDKTFTYSLSDSICVGSSNSLIASNGRIVAHISTNKNIAFNGSQSEVGNVPALVAFKDNGSLTDIGYRGETIRFASTNKESLRVTDTGIAVNGSIHGVDSINTITSNAATDNSRTNGTYAVSKLAGSVSGTGANFSVVIATSTVPAITVTSGGTHYAVNETLTIPGSSIGGGADITVTVATITSNPLKFSVGGSEKLRINSDGDLVSTGALNLTSTNNGEIKLNYNSNQIFAIDSTGIIVDDDILPGTSDTYNIGSSSLEFNNLHLKSAANAGSFVKTGGTSSQFLKADGSVDSNTYLTSQTSHSDVLVDGDFTSQGFMKRGATAGSYSVDTNSYQTSLTFSTGLTNTSGTVTADSAVTTTMTLSGGTTAQTVSTVALNAFNVLEYTMYISHSIGMQAQKLLVMCDGTNHHYTEYAVMYSVSLLGSFSTTTNGSDVDVKFTPANSGTTTVKFIKQVVA